MKVNTIQTSRVGSGAVTLTGLLDTYLTHLEEKSVVAITSKVVSLCEGNVRTQGSADKEALIVEESQYYLPTTYSRYGHHFTILNNTLIAMAGIDESNADGHYVLWPKDSQATANAVRRYLVDRFGLHEVGVIITDSTSQLMRRGTSGIALAHSGFKALRDYVGFVDLFDRPYKVTHANISGGLAAAAVVVMGEGNERTPICVLGELDFVDFQQEDPTSDELELLHLSLDDDLFEPFLKGVNWKKGGK